MKTTIAQTIWNKVRITGATALAGLALPWTLNAQELAGGPEFPSVRLHYSGTAAVLEITGSAEGYSVEVSGDLQNWQPLGDARSGRPGEFEFSDNTTSGSSSRYYRVVPRETPETNDTAVVVESYASQVKTLGFQKAMLTVSQADLQRTVPELHRLLQKVEARMRELEQRAATNPAVVQEGQQNFVVRWNDQEWVAKDMPEVDQILHEIEEERQHAFKELEAAQAEATSIMQKIGELEGDVGNIEAEIEALSLMGDDLVVSVFGLDEDFWNSPCFQLDLKSAALASLRAERIRLEQDKNSAYANAERSRVDAEKAKSRTWFAFTENPGNGSAVLVYDGKTTYFQNSEEGQHRVEGVVRPAIEQAKTDIGLLERDAETFDSLAGTICEKIANLDGEIGALEAEVEDLRKACNNGDIDPLQETQDLAFELLLLESIREMIFNDKIAAAVAAIEAENTAVAWRSIAEAPVGLAYGNEIWVFWNGNIFKFIDPFLAEEFIQFIESFRERAAQETEKSQAQADHWTQRVKELCDELDEIDTQIGAIKAGLNNTRNKAQNQNGNGGNNPPSAAAQRDTLDILIALTEAIRHAVAADKAAAVKDANNLQDKADRLAVQAKKPVSLVDPEDGQPYFIVQGIAGIVRIPVIPFPRETREQAVERTRQFAEALHQQFLRDRENAGNQAVTAQADADAAKAKAKKLCDELDLLDADLADLIKRRAAVVAQAAQDLADKLKKAGQGIIDCLKCFAKKIALAATRAAHANLVSKAIQAEKDAKDARDAANTKRAAASKGLSRVVNNTDSKAVVALGDDVHYFDKSDPKWEMKMNKQYDDFKKQREQAKKDAVAAEKAADAAEAKAKTAKEEVDKSQEKIDKCQMELGALKKNCPLC
jgi:peptidoglycan hydrolase CwlO-like protein